MPKRSNQFQQLITYITGQLAPLDATVAESVELLEQGVARPVRREVDVLIELHAGLSLVRVAVECRDRDRLDDVQWIDGLLGKYANLPVDQVIAISSSGFSEAARVKAELNNIRLMSLEEASGADWPVQFARLGVLKIEQTYSIQSVTLELEPAPKEDVSPDAEVILRMSESQIRDTESDRATIRDLIDSIRDDILAKARTYLQSHMLEIFETVADLNKTAVIEHRLPTQPGLFIRTASGSESEIKAITFKLVVHTIRADTEVRRHLLGDKAMVTSAVLTDDDDADAEYKISAVQVAGRAEGKVFVERQKRKRKRSYSFSEK